ncbi:VCBS repeat-containing protein [Zobellia laminariae]|uniref:VCBS repeat-containing protein n=1 Tax=Zobellia laminariae TaxID=248906 RepID=UPI003EF68B1D
MHYKFKGKLPYFLFSVIVLFVSCKNNNNLFEALNPDNTGVTFSNNLTYSDSLSVLDFEYMYNGAGVATADFDNDGLQDIYFIGNMNSNRLYKNLGDFKFDDITESSKSGSSNWSNGVAIVDINQDGYKDIYISKGGPRSSKANERQNLLFINKTKETGKIEFEEKAAIWGIADTGYSVQSAFFDYDSDGDLDLYVLSNDLVDYNRNVSRPKDRSGKSPSVDKLYRNNGDQTFTDVSADSGILIEGFGLGVEICDINTDGWPDVYVSNDFLTDDLLYINQQNGTFKNENKKYFKHLTYNGMGHDIGDINNDGNMDVIVLDMLPPDNERWKLTMAGNRYDVFEKSIKDGYQPQYIRNTLQLNNGNGSFSEVGQIAGISGTEWSWSALLFDYDHDGLKDLCITNGYRQDITNLDFMVYGNRILTMGTEEANRKERIAALGKLPGIKKHNYLYKNKGDFTFDDISEEAGFITPTYSSGMAYADLDNDGDLDLVINNIDEHASILKNNTNIGENKHYIKFKFQGEAPNLEGLGSQVELFYDGQLQKQYFTPYRGYLSTVEQSVHFGIGNINVIDSVQVTWPNGIQQILKDVPVNQEITLHQKDASELIKPAKKSSLALFQEIDSIGLDFKHQENEFVDYKVQPLLPHMHSKNGPGMAVADVNGDELEDVFIGGAAGQAGTLKIQQNDGTFKEIPLQDELYEDMGALFLDADSDGDQDLYIVSGGSSHETGDTLYQDRFYKNDGSGSFTKTNALPELNISGATVNAADYDKDGDLDLFIGGRIRPWEYPMAPESVLLKNESTPSNIKFEKDNQPISKTFSNLGMVTASLWTDFNNDSWLDLIVVGEFMAIRFFQNDLGKLKEVTSETGLKNTHGWWNSINAGDFDNDGDTDYILGNLGLNSRYKANAKEPLCIYASDYDKNGRIDPVMCYYNNGKNYVAHSRSDLIDQINAMRGRFRTFEDYSKATFEESFTKEEIKNAYVVKSETFANAYLENTGGGKFKISDLPRTSQIAPIYSTTISDFNDDGNLDVLAIGNFYSGETFAGRYDASIGTLLEGNGTGHFNSVNVDKSGFFVQADAKGQVKLFTTNDELIISSVNDGNLKVHKKLSRAQKVYSPKNKDAYALIEYENGKKQKIEFYYGTGYLSQGSRKLVIPQNAVSVRILDFEGNATEILTVQ